MICGLRWCDEICANLRYLRYLRFLLTMEPVFIRSEIENNSLQASNDTATKSYCHPGRETTLKKKSVHIRVHPCPIPHVRRGRLRFNRGDTDEVLSSVFPCGSRAPFRYEKECRVPHKESLGLIHMDDALT